MPYWHQVINMAVPHQKCSSNCLPSRESGSVGRANNNNKKQNKKPREPSESRKSLFLIARVLTLAMLVLKLFCTKMEEWSPSVSFLLYCLIKKIAESFGRRQLKLIRSCCFKIELFEDIAFRMQSCMPT